MEYLKVILLNYLLDSYCILLGLSSMVFFFDFGVIFKSGSSFIKDGVFNDVKGRDY